MASTYLQEQIGGLVRCVGGVRRQKEATSYGHRGKIRNDHTKHRAEQHNLRNLEVHDGDGDDDDGVI